jgi:hypothetical protein
VGEKDKGYGAHGREQPENKQTSSPGGPSVGEKDKGDGARGRGDKRKRTVQILWIIRLKSIHE